jgi:hypothetical protein
MRGARLVMSDQGPAELPPEIKSIPISVQLPEGDESVRIFSYYAGEPPSEGLAVNNSSDRQLQIREPKS